MSDSEESDGEGGLGNLNRLIVRPPGHSGKAKRGQLCFDAAFECGNLGRADHVTELEYDLYIRPDTCRPRSRLWFNFTVENVRQDQRVIFNIVNLGKEHTLYDGDMTPLVRSTSRNKWQRIPRRLIFYHRSLAHRGRKILSFAFAFDREEDVYQFATAAPYSYSRLQKYLAAWEKKAQAFATRESIAQTTQKRRVDLVTIGDFTVKEKEPIDDVTHITKSKVPDPKKRVVLIIARAHGGEPPSSYVCQGLLDYMVSSSEKAHALRDGIVIQVVPMLNPDGVFLGNQRSDLLGSDLNRCWHRASSYAHPALIAVNDVVKKLHVQKSIQLDFIIDIHADASHEGVFIRGNSFDDIFRFERHAVLPKFLAGRVEAWQPQNCLYNSDNKALGSVRRSLPIGSVDAYTLLASLGGRRLNPRGPYMHYTEDAYLKIGRSLVKALCDYYRHIGVIAPRAPVAKKEPRGRRRRRKPHFERERSPSSSSPDRRVLATRVLSPALPPAPESPPAMLGPPPRAPRHLMMRARRPVTVPEVIQHVLPVITDAIAKRRGGPCRKEHGPGKTPFVVLHTVVSPPEGIGHFRNEHKRIDDGHAVQTPRLTVVDLSAHIMTPGEARRTAAVGRPRLARPPRHAHPRLSSDDYDTLDSDT